jgi:hypothetical protein
MLGVVQQVAKDIGNVEVGQLAAFDSMFTGIRASLKSAAQRSIDVAERNLDNPLAVRLLKVLFLVKYVDSFQATPRNLTVLVYDRFGLDIPALSEQVKEALTVLETQTYIQRNGNVFEYLTKEEQDIEEEIKNVDIDASEISGRLFRILSGDVIRTSKIRYAKNSQDFPFGYKLDDQAHGQQRELAVHFISPEYPFSPEEIRMHSAGKDELRVVLEPDPRVLSDLRLLIKTEKYIKRKQGTSLSAIQGQILQARGAQSVDREKELIARVKAAVGKSTLIINGADITSSSQQALDRVTSGFQDLISRTYTQLKLLGGRTYSEQQVAGAANPDSGLFDTADASQLSVPAEEVLSFVLRKEALGEQITVKNIVDSFTAKPYGWDLASIEVLVAHLIGTSKATLMVDGNGLKRSEVAPALRNTQKHAHTVVSPQKTFDERKVADFRKFCTDFFDEPDTPKDPLELARHGADKLRAKRDELKATAAGSRYPFVSQLDAPTDLLDQVVGRPDEWYLTDFTRGGDLLDAKESTIDPIRAFLSGGQKTIYDDALALLTTHSGNLGYLPSGSDSTMRAALDDPNAFRGNKMAQLKQATDELRAKIEAVVAGNRAEVARAIEGRRAEIEQSAFYAQATPDARASALHRIDQTMSRLHTQDQVALIREIGSSFEETVYPRLLDQLAASQRTDSNGDELPQQRQTVSVKTVFATGISGVLETEADVDRYLGALRTALLQTLNDGKRISL